MKNILITGGAGFIGSKLSLKLVENGYSIRVLDNLSNQIHGSEPTASSPLYASIDGKVDFMRGSVTSQKDWIKAIEGMDAIIHLAAETGTGQSMYKIYRYSKVNILGTALMLDILANTKNHIKKIIIASSRAIYGEGKYNCLEHGVIYPSSRKKTDMEKGDFECKCPKCNNSIALLPTCEESKIHPISIYGITKQNQEQMAIAVCRGIGIPSVVFRYQNVFGPGQSLSNPYTGILSIFSTRIKNDNSLNIFEDGMESRDFVYIDDVVDATILGLENIELNGSVFNVGSGKPISVLQVAKTLIKSYGKNNSINISGNFRVGDIRHNYADLEKIRSFLGYEPKFQFEEGIEKFTNWVDSQNVQNDFFEESLNELKVKGLYH